ncbi:MAG: lysozyme, partial [Bacteroidaceae bacterium]|nr:lysozyme [Bacteroidaceae bacterium]
MQTSEQGIKMIIAFEGIEEKAYKCPSGVWTIGVGHTGKVDGRPINAGMHITQGKAMQLLHQDLAHFEEYINAEPYAKKLQQHQFDALVSFILNIGTAAFHTSTMRRKLRTGADKDSIAAEFGRWIYGKKGMLPGLV